MQKLIINADDLGINEQRNHGIFQCFEQGVLTSATLIPNYAQSDKAAKHGRERELPCGLHLNLTSGHPLSKKEAIETLLTHDGMFLGVETLERMLAEGSIDKTHIERECRAQFEWCMDHYGMPTHVDGHHHIHVHPAIAPIFVHVLDRYGISFVRIPREDALPFGYEIPKDQSEHIAKISARATAAFKIFSAHSIRTTDHFRGMALAGNASMRNLRHTLSRLGEGVCELMVHPGSAVPHGEKFDIDPQRQTEMQMLLNPDTKELLKEREITLCSYGDLM